MSDDQSRDDEALTPPSPPTSARSIRTRAVVGSMVVGIVVAAIDLFRGMAWPSAVGCGAAMAVVGQATWWVYHLSSRRNDGLAMISGFAPAFFDGRPTRLGLVALLVAIGALTGLLFGVTGRDRKPKPIAPSIEGAEGP